MSGVLTNLDICQSKVRLLFAGSGILVCTCSIACLGLRSQCCSMKMALESKDGNSSPQDSSLHMADSQESRRSACIDFRNIYVHTSADFQNILL